MAFQVTTRGRCLSKSLKTTVIFLIVINAISIIFLKNRPALKTLYENRIRFQKNAPKQQSDPDRYTTNPVVPLDPVVRYGIPGSLACPETPPHLIGVNKIDNEKAFGIYSKMASLTPDEMNVMKNYSKYLGRPLNTRLENISVTFEPINCNSSQSVAIIIPFRDREEHLRYFLGHLIPILQRQLARFSIFVVEQNGNVTFNKGRLMNTGFNFAVEAGRQAGIYFNCFIFHDVDLLPEDDRNLYRCSSGDKVVHFSTKIDKFNYRTLCCGMTVGGVIGFNEEAFRKNKDTISEATVHVPMNVDVAECNLMNVDSLKVEVTKRRLATRLLTENEYDLVNGFSNSYWGWGGEDDDMNARLNHKKLKIIRPKGELGRYTMMKHGKDSGNAVNNNRISLLQRAKQRIDTDGLTNLNTEIKNISCLPLFTKLDVEIGKP